MTLANFIFSTLLKRGQVLGAIFSLKKKTLFWKDYVIRESKQGATKVVIRCENGGENRGVPIYLNKMTITEHNSSSLATGLLNNICTFVYYFVSWPTFVLKVENFFKFLFISLDVEFP